jgi:hypothetical protein
MAQKIKKTRSRPKRPAPKLDRATEGTVDEFEREGMGIAPKE